jgi:acetyltransferase-like isoleucine patch superfamily enzyme
MTDRDATNTDSGVDVDPAATFGVAYADGTTPPQVGPGSVVRAGTVVYDDVVAGANLQTGHHALVRELTTLGDDVLVGTHAVVDGRSTLGDGISLQTGAYVPSESTLGDRVFLGPHATLLNDRFPVRADYDLRGPTLENDVSVGANATVLPDVTLGERAFVAAGAVVTADVPRETLAVGAPAEHRPLPAELRGANDL